MRTILINEAMMPSRGCYQYTPISIIEFVETLNWAIQEPGFKSFVGYPTQKIVEELVGRPVPSQGREKVSLNQNQVTIILIIKEKAAGIHGTRKEDYEFGCCEFTPWP